MVKVKTWKETAKDRRTSSPQSTAANTDQRMSNLFSADHTYKNFKCALQLLLFALLHAAVLLSVRLGPSQMHYSLNTVSEIF